MLRHSGVGAVGRSLYNQNRAVDRVRDKLACGIFVNQHNINDYDNHSDNYNNNDDANNDDDNYNDDHNNYSDADR